MKCSKILIFIFLIVSVFTSCKDYTRFYKDVSKESVNIKIERFDIDLLNSDTVALRAKYGQFFDLYTYRILGLNNGSQLSMFLNDTSIMRLYSDAEKTYKNVGDIEKELTTAFRYYKCYFPENQIPRVLFHVSGFNQAIVTTDSVVSASIDEYLGSDYPMYQQIVYQYELPFMSKDKLPIDIMYGWLLADYDEDTDSDRLLERMLNQGKLMYLLQVFFPEREPYEFLSYTEEKYEWCEKYEKEVWGYILDNKELFSSDWRTITRYMQPAPFTSGLASDSPGRIGVFIGWRIISSYMDKQKDLTLKDLMSENDAQKILQLSTYRP